MKQYILYYRVSTKRQGDSGYGLEAQRRDIELFLERFSNDPYEILGEFTDIQSGKRDDNRPELQKAIELVRKNKAILLVSKLDRLSRDVEFIARIMKKIEFRVASMPNADSFQLHIYAALAQREREFISERTKQGLAAAKARGVKLGGMRDAFSKRHAAMREIANNEAEKYKEMIKSFLETGLTQYQIADRMNQAGLRTARGYEFGAVQVGRMIKRLELH